MLASRMLRVCQASVLKRHQHWRVCVRCGQRAAPALRQSGTSVRGRVRHTLEDACIVAAVRNRYGYAVQVQTQDSYTGDL